MPPPYGGGGIIKIKAKVGTLDKAPLRETPPQKHSGITRVLKGSHSFTCTPTRSSAIGMSHTYLCLPSYSWYSFTDPRRHERLSWHTFFQYKLAYDDKEYYNINTNVVNNFMRKKDKI